MWSSFKLCTRNSMWVERSQAYSFSMPSVLKTYYAEPLINLLACEAQHIQAIHHEQEIDKLSMNSMSKGYQL